MKWKIVFLKKWPKIDFSKVTDWTKVVWKEPTLKDTFPIRTLGKDMESQDLNKMETKKHGKETN